MLNIHARITFLSTALACSLSACAASDPKTETGENGGLEVEVIRPLRLAKGALSLVNHPDVVDVSLDETHVFITLAADAELETPPGIVIAGVSEDRAFYRRIVGRDALVDKLLTLRTVDAEFTDFVVDGKFRVKGRPELRAASATQDTQSARIQAGSPHLAHAKLIDANVDMNNLPMVDGGIVAAECSAQGNASADIEPYLNTDLDQDFTFDINYNPLDGKEFGKINLIEARLELCIEAGIRVDAQVAGALNCTMNHSLDELLGSALPILNGENQDVPIDIKEVISNSFQVQCNGQFDASFHAEYRREDCLIAEARFTPEEGANVKVEHEVVDEGNFTTSSDANGSFQCNFNAMPSIDVDWEKLMSILSNVFVNGTVHNEGCGGTYGMQYGGAASVTLAPPGARSATTQVTSLQTRCDDYVWNGSDVEVEGCRCMPSHADDFNARLFPGEFDNKDAMRQAYLSSLCVEPNVPVRPREDTLDANPACEGFPFYEVPGAPGGTAADVDENMFTAWLVGQMQSNRPVCMPKTACNAGAQLDAMSQRTLELLQQLNYEADADCIWRRPLSAGQRLAVTAPIVGPAVSGSNPVTDACAPATECSTITACGTCAQTAGCSVCLKNGKVSCIDDKEANQCELSGRPSLCAEPTCNNLKNVDDCQHAGECGWCASQGLCVARNPNVTTHREWLSDHCGGSAAPNYCFKPSDGC